MWFQTAYRTRPALVLAPYTSYFHDPVLVKGNRSGCHAQDSTNVFHRFAFSEQLQDFALSAGQPLALCCHFFAAPSQVGDGIVGEGP